MAASARFTDSDGFTSITVENWPDAFAGATQTAKKFGVENNGDRVLGASPGPTTGLEVAIVAVGSNDGSTMIRIGLDTATLSPPWGLAAVVGPAGGTWGAAGTRGWRVSCLNGTGETIASFEATFDVTDTSKKVTLTWTNPAGTTQNKIFRTDTPGTYGATSRRATISVASTYDDDGAALSSGQPASENTTGGAGPAYGTPPSLGTSALQLTNLAVGQQAFFWVNRVIPGGTLEAGNPRDAITRLREV